MKIEEILKDLYMLDPDLKKHDKEIRKIISELAFAKPDVKVDRSFVTYLRNELISKMGAESAVAEVRKINWSFFANIPKAAYTTGAIVVFLFFVIFAVGNFGQQQFFPGGVKITMVADNSFGSFVSVAGEVRGDEQILGAGGGITDEVVLGYQENQSVVASALAPTIDSAKAEVFAPMGPNYEYVYIGEDLEVTEERMAVLKKIKGIDSESASRDLIKKMNLGILDLNSFSGLSLSNFNFVSKNGDGYSVNVNLREGTASIQRDYQHSILERGCPLDAKCILDPLSVDDIPDDDFLVEVVENFLRDHGVSTADYNDPEIVKTARVFGLNYRESLKESLYVPESVSVVYPLVIDGKTVYNQSGDKYGLMVGISLRDKKVESVWNITSQNYQSSLYKTVVDTSKIIERLEDGGTYWFMPLSPDSRQKVEVEFDTPEIGYVLIWKYDETNGDSGEYLVPAFIFPRKDLSEDITGSYLPVENIIVPLIEEMFEDQDGRGGRLIEPAISPVSPVEEVRVETTT